MAIGEQGNHYIVGGAGLCVLLPMDKHVFIGRNEGNTIQLNDPRASRSHSELWWDGKFFVLADLQSANGTMVNGARVNTVRIMDGDVIEIGSSRLVYRVIRDEDELLKIERSLRQRSRQQKTEEMRAINTVIPEERFSGTLATMPISEICQILNISRRSGVVMLHGSGGKATLSFINGEPIYAEIIRPDGSPIHGDEAVLAILHEKNGAFTFRPDSPSFIPNVSNRFEHLLLEAARLSDEAERIPEA